MTVNGTATPASRHWFPESVPLVVDLPQTRLYLYLLSHQTRSSFDCLRAR